MEWLIFILVFSFFAWLFLRSMRESEKEFNHLFTGKEDFLNGQRDERLGDYNSAMEHYKAAHTRAMSPSNPKKSFYKGEYQNDFKRVKEKSIAENSIKVAQKVVHGDDITKTEIKDSVLNRSSVGGGSSKMQELKDLTEMKEKGLIDDDEFKQMKKEILEK